MRDYGTLGPCVSARRTWRGAGQRKHGLCTWWRARATGLPVDDFAVPDLGHVVCLCPFSARDLPGSCGA